MKLFLTAKRPTGIIAFPVHETVKTFIIFYQIEPGTSSRGGKVFSSVCFFEILSELLDG